jgi:hypothetical protein
MEGQSWEIALVDEADKFGNQTIGVMHTPLRKSDSQILNYLLHQNNEVFVQKIGRILCPSEGCISSMQALGIPSSCLQLVEAQRFSSPAIRSRHAYSQDSKRLLYVADASSINSRFFQLQILKILDNDGFGELEFFIQEHPSGTPIISNLFKSWDSKKSGSWGLIIFGPETSAYLQPEFEDSSGRILAPVSIDIKYPVTRDASIPLFEDLSQILESILEPHVIGVGGHSFVHRNPDFPRWREVISEIFEP